MIGFFSLVGNKNASMEEIGDWMEKNDKKNLN